MIALNMLTIGTTAPQFLGMRLVAGRLLSDTRAQDRFDHARTATNENYNALIDTTAAASMGFTPEQAIGKTVILGKSHAHIVGVWPMSILPARGSRRGRHCISTTRTIRGRC